MSTATSMPASAGDDDIDGPALDPAALAFLDALPSRLRVIRARAARTREDLPARSGCEEDTLLGEAAQRVWDAEMGAVHDSASGLAARMAQVFRSASDEERLGVLNAHPDLAGKLAQAKRLTADSTAEQASAGLDSLTDDERATFTRLNDAYVAKHGFPFIIAVRDHDKAGIMAAMTRRLDNDTGTERSEAERQVARIGELRLKAMLD